MSQVNIKKFKLGELARTHQIVLVDTCDFWSGSVTRVELERYLSEINRTLKEDEATIYTTRGVIAEVAHPTTPIPIQTLQFKRFRQKNISFDVIAASRYLVSKAARLGVLGPSEYRRDSTDVGLAALALALVNRQLKVAFTSSDRRLNELLYFAYTPAKAGQYPKGFPFVIRGELEVSSFLQRELTYVPYEQERERVLSGIRKS